MNTFRFSETMKLASIWLLWSCFAICTIVWCLLVVMRGLGVADKAGWVQAIGAIITIASAAAFPYWHEGQKEKRRGEQLNGLLVFLATYQHTMMNILEKAMLRTLSEPDGVAAYAYVLEGRQQEWDAHIEALNAVPIAELRPMHVMLLGDMKVSAAVGKSLAARMREPSLDSAERRMDLAAMRVRAGATKTALAVLHPGFTFPE